MSVLSTDHKDHSPCTNTNLFLDRLKKSTKTTT